MASVDNFWAMISWFGLAIFFVAMLLFWNALNNEADDLWTGSSIGSDVKSDAENFVGVWDFISLIAYFGFHLGILVMAYLLRTHPVVIVAAILLTAILALVAAPLSNAWEDIAADDEVTDAAITTHIPKTNMILLNLPKFEIIWGIITMIVLFGMARTEGYL